MDASDKNVLCIAKKTLRMSDIGASILGGMTKEQARAHLRRLGWSDKRISDLENA